MEKPSTSNLSNSQSQQFHSQLTNSTISISNSSQPLKISETSNNSSTITQTSTPTNVFNFNTPPATQNIFSLQNQHEDIINYISYFLQQLIDKNRQMKKKQTGGPKEPLYGKKIPSLSLEQFLIRIRKYTELENNTLLLGFFYIQKIIEKKKFILGRNNVYRLLLGCCVIAIKFIEDNKYKNDEYCQIGGLSLEEFNSIEYNILSKLDFDVNATIEDINKIMEQINYFKFLSSENYNINDEDDSNK